MTSSLRALLLRVGLAVLVTVVGVGLLWWVIHGRPDLQVNDPDDLVAEVTIEEFDDLDDDAHALLQPLIEAAPGSSSSEPQVLGDRLVVAFLSNPCPRVELTVADQAGGLVVELEDRPGGCDDVGVGWMAVVELREEPVPGAPIEVVVDVPGGVTHYEVGIDATPQA